MIDTTDSNEELPFTTVFRGWAKEEVREALAHLAQQRDAGLAIAEASREAADAAREAADARRVRVGELEASLEAARAELTELRAQMGPPAVDLPEWIGDEVTEILQAAERVRRKAEREAAAARATALVEVKARIDEAESRVRELNLRADADCEAAGARAAEEAELAARERLELLEAARREAAVIVGAARGRAEDAHREAEASLASAREELARLEDMQQQVRRGLEATAAWMVRSLASSDGELATLPPLGDPEAIAAVPRLSAVS